MPRNEDTKTELPPVDSIVRVRKQPGSGEHPRDVRVLEHLDGKRLKVLYVAIGRESDIALQRLERTEAGSIRILESN